MPTVTDFAIYSICIKNIIVLKSKKKSSKIIFLGKTVPNLTSQKQILKKLNPIK